MLKSFNSNTNYYYNKIKKYETCFFFQIQTYKQKNIISHTSKKNRYLYLCVCVIFEIEKNI